MPRRQLHRFRTLVLIAAALMAGSWDDRGVLPTQPSAVVRPSLPQPPLPPLSSGVQSISVGQVIDGMIVESDSPCSWNFPRPCRQFELTAPRSGTLVVTLTWDPYYWDTFLFLRLEGADIPGNTPPYSPVVGRLPMVAGQTYRLGVGLFAAGTAFESGFSLRTALE